MPGVLEFIAKLVFEAEGDNEHAKSQSLAGSSERAECHNVSIRVSCARKMLLLARFDETHAFDVEF